MFIQIEETPNPNTLKFLPGFAILNEGETADFSNANEIKNSELAANLFQIEHVVRVFFGHDFISVTKSNGINWDILKVEVLTTIMDHFTSGGKALDKEGVNDNNIPDEEFFDENDIEIVNRIKELMESYIKPAVAQDGGDIKFRGYKDGIVYVELQGACSGCPSAAITLKQGVQNMLSYHIPEVAEQTTSRISSLYGFLPAQTPIFEYTEVFTKTLGDSSDIITKEMYTFNDKGGKSITLRPEFTAAIVRLLIEKKLQTPIKLFSTGPAFRYERPQKGRQRQFHQINFEVFGIEDPKADIELISLAQHLLTEFGINKNVKLEINSLGDGKTITKYREALILYFTKHQNDLSEDSKNRLIKNPLRILDSKDEKDKSIISDAPKISDYYTKESSNFFEQILNGLTTLDIPYTVNNKLVRGLDYYCHTVFEFVTEDLGAQGAVFAGGRYDNLVSSVGGKHTPAIGFAGGIERIMELINYSPKEERPIYLIPIGKEAEEHALTLANELRRNGLYVVYEYSGTLKNRMKKANQANAKAALIFGDEELSSKTLKIKNMDTGEEKIIARDNTIENIN
ncbi:histidine--tRNA ligase [Trichonephila inaurata madagascariensis]|uniref:NFU1 iron-sulfur cluster scaffold homolog, mitochondrial n=1 Tax=Trichonephila inaurata madagascariensis TaxID=2747483 RepID=A0A8X6Y537_9ARAC|nr:histidine--tRNA ligase [Trichonephila inaurata madagascariensis]GFY80013.1 histidine--tRNA ligase [Trichonephila inaurata madagascariensis]